MLKLYEQQRLTRAQDYLNSDKQEFRRPIAEWDVSLLLRLMRASWDSVFRSLGQNLHSLVDVLLFDGRNPWAHQGDFTNDETEQVRVSVSQLLRAISPAPGPKVLQMFNEHLEEELYDPTWPEVLSSLWPKDWFPEFHRAYEDDGSFRELFFASLDVRSPAFGDGLSLYVLPMNQPYRTGAKSPAESLAAEILSSMRFRNCAVFLAPHEGCLADLRKLACKWRAWQEVLRDAADLTPEELEATEALLEEARRALQDELRVAYRWLLVPKQASLQSPMEWEAINLAPSPNPVERAWQELVRVGNVVMSLDPKRLADELHRAPLWQSAAHVKIEHLAHEFSRHMHLPRLRHWAVLDRVIAVCLATPGWESFAYAMDEATKVLYFRGTGQTPSAGLLMNRVGFLVKPEAARAQLR